MNEKHGVFFYSKFNVQKYSKVMLPELSFTVSSFLNM